MSPLTILFCGIILFSNCIMCGFGHGQREKNPLQGQVEIEDDPNPFRRAEILDLERKYRLEWLVDWDNNQINFNVTVATLGYVGFGLNWENRIAGGDIINGGVDSRTGEAYFTDRHGISDDGEAPAIDWKQDWFLNSAWENATHTSLSFSRLIDTCDTNEDILIDENSLFLLWAYGETDDLSEYHRGNRGGVPRYLLDPDVSPAEIILQPRNQEVPPPNMSPDIKVWSVKSVMKIPPKRTTYWCSIRKLELPGKHHIIGYTFKVNNETYENVHHAVLLRCVGARPEVYEKYVTHPGEECYVPTSHPRELPFESCIEWKGSTGIGTVPYFYPEHVGYPIGEHGRTDYFMFQMHYDNPELRDDLVSENQIDIYYTSKLREHDGGALTQGHTTHGSPSLLIPPNSLNHKILGFCSEACTRKMLPPEGIKIFAVSHHAHDQGVGLVTHHIRNGRELPFLLEDNNFQFRSQQIRLLRKEIDVLPGDLVYTTCTYDTSAINKTTVGGYGTDQEMCMSFIFYYNLLTEHPFCQSQIISQDYNDRYIAGGSNFTWNLQKLEVAAGTPPHLSGMTVSEISDSEYVDWSPERRAALQFDHIFHPQMDFCLNTEEILEVERTGVAPPPTSVSFPVWAQPYQRPPRQCNLAY